jgi:uncharacterized protein (TIGR02186 family)
VSRTASALAAVLLASAPAAAQQPQPQPLVIDLSNSVVSITTGFAGADLLLFGAFDGQGDLGVVVTGPRRNETVWQKQRVAGIWLNGQSMTFIDVPSFYRVAATAELTEMAPPDVLDRLQIGVERIPLPVAPGTARSASPETIEAFRAALIRNKQFDGLYGLAPAPATVVGGRLFRASIHLPGNVPTGTYQVETHLFQNRKLIASRATSLTVERAGFGDAVYRFAFDHSALYGLVAILLALMAGWTASLLFRRT